MDDDDPLDDARLSRAMDARTPLPARRPWNTEGEWQRLRARIAAESGSALSTPAGVRGRAARVARWLSAATILVALTAYLVSRDASSSYRTASTSAGQRATLELGDGTRVTLGPASSLRYAIRPGERDAELTGLAQFEVRHDPRRPFRVRTSGAETVDLGTTFVVRAYPDEQAVLVAVSDGSVSLRAGGAAVALSAGQVGRAGIHGVARTALTTAPYMDWAEGRLSFTDASLDDVARELSRWFGADVRADPSLSSRRISATYDHPTLSSALSAIARATGARVARSSGAILFVPAQTPREP
jgi:transmembrane sensor